MSGAYRELTALCSCVGVETEYVDIWGQHHRVSPETLLAILTSMGIDVSSEAAVQRARLRWDRRGWDRLLPAAVTVGVSDPDMGLDLVVPEWLRRISCRWRLVAEGGEEQEGTFSPDGLSVLAYREIEGVPTAKRRLPLPVNPGLGYHYLEVEGADVRAATQLIVVPEKCFRPSTLAKGRRLWGPAIQLYALRSRRNWGMGDFSDLRHSVAELGQLGASAVGLNPLHALFLSRPAQASPYSPSSRQFLNPLYLDVEAVTEFSQCREAQELVFSPDFQRQLSDLREATCVDYHRVAALKLRVLELLYRHFRNHHLARESDRSLAFRAFQAEAGEALHLFALYCAIDEAHSREGDRLASGMAWPPELQDPTAPDVGRFARDHRERLEFHAYLQWQADAQLAESTRVGLAVGLLRDLALGSAPGGADMWANPCLYATGIGIGAPPDDFNLQGQNWGLPPPIPHRLADVAYGPFIETLRANMRHAGALRIDHVMGLMRLFWIPDGSNGRAGTYVHYPFPELLGILALESQRHHCLIIGEDLGTVPDEVREALVPKGILSQKLLFFERDQEEGGFAPPAAYPQQAAAAVTTHDLPTLAGWWKGEDLAERTLLMRFPSEEVRGTHILARADDRARLLLALKRERLLPEGATVDPASCPEMTPALVRAIWAFLAHTPAGLVLVHFEDLLGQLAQVNLPGTTEERANWRYRLALNLEDQELQGALRQLAETMRLCGRAQRVPQLRLNPEGCVRCADIPRATYRLQFSRAFTFADAAAVVPYLARLGISHVYGSPYLKARSGSLHGYDIVDHNTLNPEIGTPEEYDRFISVLQGHRMGHILDTVPNHMGVGSDNGWWLDVLENGPASLHAGFFDIDWQPLKQELRGKVLLPVLGDHYGRVLKGGDLRLVFDAQRGAFSVHYFEHLFPLDPKTYPHVVTIALPGLFDSLGGDDPSLVELQSLVTAFRNLPSRAECTAEEKAERHRDKEVHKRHLARLCAENAEISKHVADATESFNQPGGDGVDLLHALLDEQAYRLAFWRVAADEINYRRFFDINDLAGLRMEEPQVFFATHRLVTDLVSQGKVNGLRIDHPDGLCDPADYCTRLQTHVGAARGTPDRRDGDLEQGCPAENSMPLYVLVEKILAGHERLPDGWAVHGTTGYEFANLLTGLLVQGASERKLDQIYSRFIGRRLNLDDLLYQCKKLIVEVALSSELNVLANKLDRISEADRLTRDFTRTALRSALVEVVACFPVYRTYVTAEHASAEDRRHVEWAVALAKKRSPATDVSVFDFIACLLLLERLDDRPTSYRQAVVEFSMRFQQYSAPVMAKALEDTCFYIYNRLVSLNEVGGDPRRMGVSRAGFHRANMERMRRWPHSLLCTSTHDTKRSEDVRARINVLSELPDVWRKHLARWSRLNRPKKRRVDDVLAPSRNDEYLLYQTLLGAWPLEDLGRQGLAAFCERTEGYMLKAVREAKVHTSWMNPNQEYEAAVKSFVRALLRSGNGRNAFLADFLPFKRRVASLGMLSSLSQVVLKLTAPGVPDIYQGNETWRFSLVDPDNRRSVDYRRQEQALTALQDRCDGGDAMAGLTRELLDTLEDGRGKLYVTWRLLALRSQDSELFEHGDYTPLAVEGTRSEHLCAFARQHQDRSVVVVVPRWFAKLTEEERLPLGEAVWQGTWVEVPGVNDSMVYRNALTGEAVTSQVRGDKHYVAAASVLRSFVVAILTQSGN